MIKELEGTFTVYDQRYTTSDRERYTKYLAIFKKNLIR